MRKIVILTLLLALIASAKSVAFSHAPNDIKRVMPNSKKEILSFYEAIKDAKKSVVNISTKKKLSPDVDGGRLFDDPIFRDFFRDYFGNRGYSNKAKRSLGSGVIVTSDGYIVTNNHVIKNASEVTVSFPGSRRKYKAKIIGGDEGSDLAVIKIEVKNLTPIIMGDSDSLREGDIVFAIGNPFGIGETVTQGIISALNKDRMGINKYENFIQTDASINPGNPGGALVDSRGALIGINAAIMTRSGGNNGVGFAIPVNMVKNIAKKLIIKGKVTRGYMGVSISDMNKEYESVYIHKKGALVLDVQSGSAAEKNGIKRGDLIFELNGKPINSGIDLQKVIGSFDPSEKVEIKLERNKREIVIKMALGARDGDINIAKGEEVLGGVYLSNLNSENRRKYRIAQDVKGVLITNVKVKSRAEIAGFQSGDVITGIEELDVENISDVEKMLKKHTKEYKRVYINRYGKIYLIVIK